MRLSQIGSQSRAHSADHEQRNDEKHASSAKNNKGHIQKAPFMTHIIAVANQKGGVGKTTTAVNLGTAMAATHRSVLVIDLDPQGNASTGLGVSSDQRHLNVYDVLLGRAELNQAVVTTSIPGLFVLPSDVNLSGAEIELIEMPEREFRLCEALTGQAVAYDYILIDCPPSLGMLTINALCASQEILVPLQCEFYALEGLSHLLRIVRRVQRNLNAHLELKGVVLTMYDRRNNLCDQVAEDVRGHFGDKVFKTVIPRNVRVSEAPSHGRPVLLYDHRCVGSQAYIHLAGEILRQNQESTVFM